MSKHKVFVLVTIWHFIEAVIVSLFPTILIVNDDISLTLGLYIGLPLVVLVVVLTIILVVVSTVLIIVIIRYRKQCNG